MCSSYGILEQFMIDQDHLLMPSKMLSDDSKSILSPTVKKESQFNHPFGDWDFKTDDSANVIWKPVSTTSLDLT